MALGMFIGSQRELMWTLEDRARRAEEQQAARVAQARAAEREQIAREMHDVLAHRISLVAMHAGRARLPDRPGRGGGPLLGGLIQDQAHEALTDLRAVLGVLRDETSRDRGATPAALRPQPTYADLPSLVTDARQAGMQVRSTSTTPTACPTPSGAPSTGSSRRGSRTPASTRPTRTPTSRCVARPEEVVVTVANATGPSRPRVPGAGLGLVGLRSGSTWPAGRSSTA